MRQGRGCETNNVFVLQSVYEMESCYVNTDRWRSDGNIDCSNKQTSKWVLSVYESECVMHVLCVGQGFVVRKDMDHFSQLIHSMYTVHPHQRI